ncbi:MAG TPA: PDZ domain-containing protein, partial [Bacteroidetes bacterium]|nr:PDZ domain-containing protein [Bacteroidota bacterium]HEX05146.1 PDZ domain-containing protein [Bacteroidota bacterium]
MKIRHSSSSVAGLVLIMVLAGIISIPMPSYSQSVDMQDSRYAMSTFESPFVAVAERLKPGVVFISAVREREIRIPAIFENHPFFKDMIPNEQGAPRTQRIPSSGSGFIIDAEGYIITNNHVVQGASEITVTLVDGEEIEAEVIGTDPETDLALLKIGPVPADHVVPLGDSDAIRIGDWAIAMGNPLGLDWTLTVGVISAKGRSNLNISGGGPIFQDFIQTDASINFGNSGGPLTNIRGEVIGINAALNAAADGIGFAIPINLAKDVISQLREDGHISRGYLGMMPRTLSALLREALGLDEDVDGVFVESVEAGTPAEDGGLRESDVVTEVDGLSVDNVNDFRFRIARHAPGDRMELEVLRDGRKKDLDFVLGDRNEYLNVVEGETPVETRVWMGLSVENVDDPAVRRNSDFQVDSGVVVMKVADDSPAQGVLRPGDVIVQLDQREI